MGSTTRAGLVHGQPGSAARRPVLRGAGRAATRSGLSGRRAGERCGSSDLGAALSRFSADRYGEMAAAGRPRPGPEAGPDCQPLLWRTFAAHTGSRHHRHRRQNVLRPLHRPSPERSRNRALRAARHPWQRRLWRGRSGAAHHTRPDPRSALAGWTGGHRAALRGDGGFLARPGSGPGQRGALRSGGADPAECRPRYSTAHRAW